MVKNLGLMLILLSSAPLMAAPELKGSPEELRGFLHPQERTVRVSAEAEETAYSDVALVYLAVTTEKNLLSKALQANTDVRDNVRRQLVDSGIAATAINSSKFSSTPQYGWFGKDPDSFKVVNRMVVRISEESHLQAIATIADKFEEVVLSETTFEHSQEETYQQKVKEQALQKVMEKKAYYEKKLGVTLKPVAFYDNPVPMQPTDGAVMVEEVVVSAMRKNDSFASRQEAPRARTPSSFDEVTYRTEVTVEFNIQ